MKSLLESSQIRAFGFVVACVAASLASAAGAGYLEEFKTLRNSGDDAKIQEFLERAAQTEKENPDYYATASNYWWSQAQSLSITTKPPEKDDFAVSDPKTGKTVGSISTLGRADPAVSQKVLDILAEGMQRFPARADIAFGLANVQRKLGLENDYASTLSTFLAYAKDHSQDLLWMENKKLPQPAETFIPESAYSYIVSLYQHSPEDPNNLCVKVCDQLVAAFPNHPYAYNIKAAVRIAQHKLPEAISLLEKAHQIAPSDELILLNLGDLYARSKRKGDAKKAYREALNLPGATAETKAQAKKGLKALE